MTFTNIYSAVDQWFPTSPDTLFRMMMRKVCTSWVIHGHTISGNKSQSSAKCFAWTPSSIRTADLKIVTSHMGINQPLHTALAKHWCKLLRFSSSLNYFKFKRCLTRCSLISISVLANWLKLQTASGLGNTTTDGETACCSC